jgi:hypothetical protein
MLLAGCASQQTVPVPTHRGESSYRMAAAQGMVRYELPLGATSSGAVPIDHSVPAYPKALLAGCPPPVRLRALLIVGVDGNVDEVRVAPAPGVDPAFAAAVRAAALQWRFEPLRIDRWAADANGDTHPVESVAKPFSLPYEFSFACRDGKPQTGVGAGTPAP